jgi:hypothetical protein
MNGTSSRSHAPSWPHMAVGRDEARPSSSGSDAPCSNALRSHDVRLQQPTDPLHTGVPLNATPRANLRPILEGVFVGGQDTVMSPRRRSGMNRRRSEEAYAPKQSTSRT